MKAKTFNVFTYVGLVWAALLSVLKCTHVITWSWWFVFPPVYIAAAIVVACIIYVSRAN